MKTWDRHSHNKLAPSIVGDAERKDPQDAEKLIKSYCHMESLEFWKRYIPVNTGILVTGKYKCFIFCSITTLQQIQTVLTA
jgi:hypothetical protein